MPALRCHARGCTRRAVLPVPESLVPERRGRCGWCRRGERRGCRRRRGCGARPPTTDPGPRCPRMPSTSAPTMNSTAQIGRRPRQHGRAAARAERRLAAAAAKRAGDVAALALLEQDHQHQHEADEHVRALRPGSTASKVLSEKTNPIIQPRGRLRDDDLEKAPDVQAGAADQRPVHVGLRDQIANVVGLHAAAVDDVAQLGRPPARTTGAAAAGCGRAPRPPARASRSGRCRSPRPARRR